MRIERADLDEAIAQQILTGPQAAALWRLLQSRQPLGAGVPAPAPEAPQRRFTGLNVAYYFGALLVIAAMGWLMTLGWETFGGKGIFLIATLYAFFFTMAGLRLLAQPQTRTPGGLLVTMAVCMTPLAVYGLERMTGLWPGADPGNYRGFFPWIRGGWFAMEAATVLAGLIALRKVRFPFLVAPIALVLWFMSMDAVPALFHAQPWDGDIARRVSIAFGLALMFVAFQVDHRTEEDYAFWLYFFGMISFWGAITSMHSDRELSKLLYCAMNLGFVVLSVLLRRRIFLVVGAIGVNAYLGHLAWRVFEHSLIFPFVLTLLGLGIITAAVYYQRHRAAIELRIESWVPLWVRDLLPPARLAAR
ncbi:MAG TPA: hypothetical protein VKB92_14580 [Myxococcales bacterium]|nr:hypothetical protein [Myxococcales bacterium]